jgi:hypothetical protein
VADITVTVSSPGLIAYGEGDFGNNTFGGEGFSLPLSQNSVVFSFNSGWGSNEWGQYTWGIVGDIAAVTGSQLNVANNLSSITVIGTANQDVSGQQLNTNINGVTVTGTANLGVTGSRLNVEIGNENATTDVSVSVTTAGRLNLSEGSVTAEGEIREGWGVYQWGAVPWGGEQDPEVNVIGSALEAITHPVDIQIDGNISVNVDEDDDITIALGNATARTDVAFNVTGSRLNISEGLTSVLIIIDVNVSITGSQVNLNIGQVEAFQETPVPVTGSQINVLIGNESTTADANVSVTGSQLNGSLGQIKYIATYSVTGSQANLSVGTVTFVITGSTTVTGSRLNISEGSVNIQGWSEVQTGANNTWTPVDIAA